MSRHIENQHKHPELVTDNTLHVVAVCSNPARYHSRYRLTREFMTRMGDTPNVKLYMVETAFGDRHHEVTVTGHDLHLQLRTHSEIWVKENQINLGVRYLLPRNWKYMAWVDADVDFRDPYWAQETIHQLQHFPVLQPFQQALDLDSLGGVMATHQSFGYLTQRGVRIQKHSGEPYQYGHTGYAWACTRSWWEHVGGLVDFAILGSGDHHMGWAIIGSVDSTIHRGMSPAFFRKLQEWQSKAVVASHREVGFVPGRIEHHFHGAKANRKYRERWKILVDHKFDPDKNLMHDEAGVLQLINNPGLEKAIRQYNRERREDDI